MDANPTDSGRPRVVIGFVGHYMKLVRCHIVDIYSPVSMICRCNYLPKSNGIPDTGKSRVKTITQISTPKNQNHRGLLADSKRIMIEGSCVTNGVEVCYSGMDISFVR